MLSECLEVFREQFAKHQDALILDHYIPSDGTYVLVNDDGTIKSIVELKLDKKTRTMDRSAKEFAELCFYDYNSQLVSMNKSQDTGKIVHSNNYYSFWVKKDSVLNGKLTESVIDRYYHILANPEKKYEKSKAKEIYQTFEEQNGKIDRVCLEAHKNWIKEHIFKEDDRIDMTRKDYLKIFFVHSKEAYEREGKRYFLPNIYNSNDYNEVVNGEVCGIPDNNLNMNAKKPYLSIKTRKCAGSYLLNGEDVLVQKKFFDYLMNFAAAGQCNIYVDLKKRQFQACKNGEFPKGSFSGFFLRIQKGKEVEIHSQDVIPFYNKILPEPFEFQNVLGMQHEKNKELNLQYTTYKTRCDLESFINEIFFSKILTNNYFTEAENLSITDGNLKRNLLTAREVLFNWLYKGIEENVHSVIKKVSYDLVKGSILNGYREKAVRQMNLRWSFIEYLQKGGTSMASILYEVKAGLREKMNAKETQGLESDREYYFAIGQLASYFIAINKSAKKTQSLINPFLNAKTNKALVERLKQYYKKYNYAINHDDRRVRNLLAMITGYQTDGEVNQEMVIMGYTCNNLVFEKGDK